MGAAFVKYSFVLTIADGTHAGILLPLVVVLLLRMGSHNGVSRVLVVAILPLGMCHPLSVGFPLSHNFFGARCALPIALLRYLFACHTKRGDLQSCYDGQKKKAKQLCCNAAYPGVRCARGNPMTRGVCDPSCCHGSQLFSRCCVMVDTNTELLRGMLCTPCGLFTHLCRTRRYCFWFVHRTSKSSGNTGELCRHIHNVFNATAFRRGSHEKRTIYSVVSSMPSPPILIILRVECVDYLWCFYTAVHYVPRGSILAFQVIAVQSSIRSSLCFVALPFHPICCRCSTPLRDR